MSLHEAPPPNPRAKERRVTSRKDADFWITPAWATEALLERELFPNLIWECACGEGAMARVLGRRYGVEATDLQDRGFGKGGVDFLLEQQMIQVQDGPRTSAIVTNPPFSLASEFIAHAHKLGPRKIAMFGPIGLLAGQERGRFYEAHPWSRIWVFSRRVTLLAGALASEGVNEAPADMRGATNFAWFVWERNHPPAPVGFIQ